jgi:signal transduction histidine kinase
LNTPRRSANTGQLVQSERLHTLGQLVAGVIHEMNNPLTIVNTNLQVLADYVQQLQHLLELYQQAGVSNQAIADYSEEIDLPYLQSDLPRILASVQEGSGRALSLVDELRRYSASNSPEVGPVDLRERLMSTVRLVESSYRQRVTFRLEIDRLPPIMGVAGQVQQVFMNLLINACQSIQGRGEVIISSDADTDDVTIRIRDTGSGIGPDVLPRIFEPYFSTKSAADGTGLGLPITKRIVEKHGGRLEVASVLGEGTTFTIVLPIEGAFDLADDGMPYEL